MWITFSRQYWLSILYYLYACCPLVNFMCTMAVSIYQMAGIVFPTYSEQVRFEKREAAGSLFRVLRTEPELCTH